jgi:hypothetical protein
MSKRYDEWLKNNPQPLAMTPEEQREYRRKIISGCIGIDDCWVWTGARTSAGYGKIRVGYTVRIVSRVALCLKTNSTLSTPADACHIPECLSRACCNPAHLFWGKHQENCSMREHRDMRWERYITALAGENKSVFVVFEKRFKPGWGILDCRTVQQHRYYPTAMPNHNPICSIPLETNVLLHPCQTLAQ